MLLCCSPMDAVEVERTLLDDRYVFLRGNHLDRGKISNRLPEKYLLSHAYLCGGVQVLNSHR